MKKLFNIGGILLLIILFCPVVSWGLPVEGGAHLWLSTDPAMFDQGGDGYVWDVGDPWLDESYVTYNNPFDLYIYHALQNAVTAIDIQLLVAVHAADSGTVTVDGTDYTSFALTSIAPEYGSGNHGIHDNPPGAHGQYAIVPLGFDLDPLTFASVNVSWTGFSEVHFDVISSNNFWNPPSHDATAVVPEPGTIMLLGIGLLGLGFCGRKRFMIMQRSG